MEYHPCGICRVHVLETDEAIQCDGKCSLWHHRECLAMTLDTYLNLSRDQSDWVCRKCVKIKQEIKQEAQTTSRLRQRHSPVEMGKSSKSDFRQLDFISESQKCTFCQTTEINELKYGPVYMHKNIVTHYYCLLLSSNMEQNGRDSDGILGFLASDITKEVRRGSKLYCTFCRARGSTLGCAVAKCKVVFHLPCGLKHGTLHQFFGEFKSFCNKHRPVQKISENILAESSKGAMCGICYEKVIPRPVHDTLWAPCCQKNAFFHRDCVQKLATSAGYFFKCPLCNNVDAFQQAMKEFGIFIPEQDASWERVPDAYQDLLVRHDSCDSASCKCPSGRKTNIQGTRWELILCKFCGSQGVHIGCGRLKWKSPEFGCEACTENNTAGNTNVQGDRHRLAPATPPSTTINREVERSRQRTQSESSDGSLPSLSNRRRRVASPRSSTSSPTPSPKRKRRSPTPEPRNRRATTPDHRKYRAGSPDHRKYRGASPDHRKYRGASPDQRKHRTLSPDHRKRRPSSPDHRKHRTSSPDYRKYRNVSPDERNYRAVTPEQKRPTHEKPTKPKRERKQYKSKAIVIDDSDEDIQVVDIPDISNLSGCLKTSDGSTIQVVPVLGGQNNLSVEGDVRVLDDDDDDLDVVDTNVNFPKVQVPSPPPLKEVVYSLPPPPPQPQLHPQPSTSTSLPPAFNPAQSYVLVDPSTYRPQDLPPGAILYRSVQPVVNVPPPQQQLGSSSDADAKYSDLSKYRGWSRFNFNPQYLPIQETSSDAECDSAGQRRRRYYNNRLSPHILLYPLLFRFNNGLWEVCLRQDNKYISKRKASPLASQVIKKLKKSSKPGKKKEINKKKIKTELKLSRSLFSNYKSKHKSTVFSGTNETLNTTKEFIAITHSLISACAGNDELRTHTREHKQLNEISTSLQPKSNKSGYNSRKIEDFLIKVDKTSSLRASNTQNTDNPQDKEELKYIKLSTKTGTEVPLDLKNQSESKDIPSTSNDNQLSTNQDTGMVSFPLSDTFAIHKENETNSSVLSVADKSAFKEEMKSSTLVDLNTSKENTLSKKVVCNQNKTSDLLPLLSNDNLPLTNGETDRKNQLLVQDSVAIMTNKRESDNLAVSEEIKCLQLIDTNTVYNGCLSTKGIIKNRKKSKLSVVEAKKHAKKKTQEQNDGNQNKLKKIKLTDEKNTLSKLYPKTKKQSNLKKKIYVNKLSMIDNYFQRVEKEWSNASFSENGQSSSDTSIEEKKDSKLSLAAKEGSKLFFQLARPEKMLDMARSVARMFD